MLEKLKEKANEALKIGSKIANQTTVIVKDKTNEAIIKYQEYQDRERDVIPQYLVNKIDEHIKNSYKKLYLKGEVMPGKCLLIESKIGGFPYLPKDMGIPKDNEGNDMRLLVQLNCEDLSSLEFFPKHGLLQIFLKRDNNYGLNDYKVIFHSKIDNSVKINELYNKTLINELEFFPIRKECNLYFTKDYDTISIKDIRYFNNFKQILKSENNYKDFTHQEISFFINNDTEKTSIKVNGNPNYRRNNIDENNLILLFQLVPDGKYIQTNNDAILSFFIQEEDLINLNFNNVIYKIYN